MVCYIWNGNIIELDDQGKPKKQKKKKKKKKTNKLIANQLTHCSLETPKRVIGKQCSPWSDAAKCGIWSGSPLSVNSSTIFL